MKNKVILNFNGTELEFFFGLSFVGEFLKENDLDLKGVFDSVNKEPFSFIPKLMFHSYKHNMERKGLEVALSPFELADLIEETGHFKDGSESAKFIEPFLQSLLDSLPIEKEEKGNAPKKK